MTMGRAPLGRYPLAADPAGAFGTHLTIDLAMPTNIAGTLVKRDSSSPVSWSTAIRRDMAEPLSWTAGFILAIDGVMPLEWSTGIKADQAVALAFLQGVVVPVDSAIPLAFTAVMPRDFAMPLAFEGTPFILGEVIRPATPNYVLVPQRPRGI